MKLSVSERVHLTDILPRQGDILTVKVVQTILEKIDFSIEELKKWSVKREDNSIRWDDKVAKDVEIEITNGEETVIVSTLRELSEKKTLSINHLSLWDKFLGKKEGA